MSNVLIYDESTNLPIQWLKSVNTPLYSSRTDVLINPVLPEVPLQDMIVDGGLVREQTTEEKAARDAAIVLKQEQDATAELYNISFEDMPVKLPGLSWAILDSAGLTDAERKIVILSFRDFYTFVQSGHIAMAVAEINALPVPEGVDSAKWTYIIQTINSFMV